MEDPSTGQAPPQAGDLFERTFLTPRGPVDFLAEVVIEGAMLILKDIVVYSHSGLPETGLAREAFAARTQIIREAKAWGFATLRLTGLRVPSSSSGNPGHPVDVSVDLTR